MPYIYLALSTLFGVCFAQCYKYAAHRKCELRAVNLWVHVAATATLLIYFLITGAQFHMQAFSFGLFAGIGAYLATIAFLYHMNTGQLAVSWTVIGLAVSIPIIVSITFWSEHPTPKQWVGLALIPVAFYLLGSGRKR